MHFKDTHREKAPSNEAQVLTKSMSMNFWVVGTLNLVFVRGSYNEIKFSKKKSSWKNSVLFVRSILYSLFYLS